MESVKQLLLQKLLKQKADYDVSPDVSHDHWHQLEHDMKALLPVLPDLSEPLEQCGVRAAEVHASRSKAAMIAAAEAVERFEGGPLLPQAACIKFLQAWGQLEPKLRTDLAEDEDSCAHLQTASTMMMLHFLALLKHSGDSSSFKDAMAHYPKLMEATKQICEVRCFSCTCELMCTACECFLWVLSFFLSVFLSFSHCVTLSLSISLPLEDQSIDKASRVVKRREDLQAQVRSLVTLAALSRPYGRTVSSCLLSVVRVVGAKVLDFPLDIAKLKVILLALNLKACLAEASHAASEEDRDSLTNLSCAEKAMLEFEPPANLSSSQKRDYSQWHTNSFQSSIEGIQIDLKELRAKVGSSAEARLEEIVGRLEPIAGGLSEGKLWKDTVKTSVTLRALAALGSGSIGQASTVKALKTGLAECNKDAPA